MNPGRLRHRIIIQELTDLRDPISGEIIDTDWQDVCTVWAEIRALRGREYFAAQQTIAESSHEITIRYRKGIKPTMRAVHDDRIFDIQAVLDKDGKMRYLSLVCKEVG